MISNVDNNKAIALRAAILAGNASAISNTSFEELLLPNPKYGGYTAWHSGFLSGNESIIKALIGKVSGDEFRCALKEHALGLTPLGLLLYREDSLEAQSWVRQSCNGEKEKVFDEMFSEFMESNDIEQSEWSWESAFKMGQMLSDAGAAKSWVIRKEMFSKKHLTHEAQYTEEIVCYLDTQIMHVQTRASNFFKDPLKLSVTNFLKHLKKETSLIQGELLKADIEMTSKLMLNKRKECIVAQKADRKKKIADREKKIIDLLMITSTALDHWEQIKWVTKKHSPVWLAGCTNKFVPYIVPPIIQDYGVPIGQFSVSMGLTVFTNNPTYFMSMITKTKMIEFVSPESWGSYLNNTMIMTTGLAGVYKPGIKSSAGVGLLLTTASLVIDWHYGGEENAASKILQVLGIGFAGYGACVAYAISPPLGMAMGTMALLDLAYNSNKVISLWEYNVSSDIVDTCIQMGGEQFSNSTHCMLNEAHEFQCIVTP